MNTQPKFVRSDNFLTRYAHACGYLDSATISDDPQAITLGIDGACYHVRARPYNGHDRVWECFRISERGEAVKLFRRLIRERRATRNMNRTYHCRDGFTNSTPREDRFPDGGGTREFDIGVSNMKEAKLQQKPTWSDVCEHFGLDTSFRYSDSQRAEYYRLLSEDAVEQSPETVGRTLAESADVDVKSAKADEINVLHRQYQLELTPSQVTILKTYANGDYAHLADCLNEEAFDAELDQCGDTLFRFLMSETSKREDCLSHAETISRIDNAIRDLTTARGAVNKGPEWSLEELSR